MTENVVVSYLKRREEGVKRGVKNDVKKGVKRGVGRRGVRGSGRFRALAAGVPGWAGPSALAACNASIGTTASILKLTTG